MSMPTDSETILSGGLSSLCVSTEEIQPGYFVTRVTFLTFAVGEVTCEMVSFRRPTRREIYEGLKHNIDRLVAAATPVSLGVDWGS